MNTSDEVIPEQIGKNNQKSFLVTVSILSVVGVGIIGSLLTVLIMNKQKKPITYTNPFTSQTQQTTPQNPFVQPTASYQNPFAQRQNQATNQPYQNPFEGTQ